MVKSHKKDNEFTKNLIFYSFIFIVLLLSVVVFIYIRNDDNRMYYSSYNKFDFQKSGDYWRTEIGVDNDPLELFFYEHPLDLEDILIDTSILDQCFKVDSLTFAIEHNASNKGVLGIYNMARITAQVKRINTQSALYILEEERGNYNFTNPMVDCSDSDESNMVFWVQPGLGEDRIYRSEEYPNCIIVSSMTNESILGVADMFSYRILGIMK